ncbi:MAG: DUF3800 domain-containing protein, partial [bacterium]|nr:DUF3800 domain-containing protein [bacterium]
MEFDIYCDESRQDLFNSKSAGSGNYIILGGVWFETEQREFLKDKIKEIQCKHGKFYEMKWKSVSDAKIDYYLDIVRYFFDNDIRFRSIIIDSEKIDLIKFHSDDSELAFYKFY